MSGFDMWHGNDEGILGWRDVDEMEDLYEDTVDKDEYPSFEDWLWDMERSGTFYRYHVERIPS